ncbi:MAG: CoA-binding protein [Thermodesulfobacteriota bacterium]|nr:CoA-binding protein [Thermodesulfobacteriota bacterium]
MNSEKTRNELEPIFNPRSIAIAGASSNEKKMGSMMLRNFLAAGFKGNIYPVNPGGGSTAGMKIYSSIRDIKGHVDYVIVAVPANYVLGLLDDCVAKGVKAVQFFSAGFSETGREDGLRLEEEMVSKARNAGIRIIGPNCVGISCPAIGIPVPSTGGIGKAGSIAFLSQSGGHTETIADIGCAREIRFNRLISFGNGCDLNEIDFLNFLAVDRESRIISVYLEDGRNGQDIFRLMRDIARSKPVIVWKGGESEVGGETASSHTGSLAGSDIMWKAAIHQARAVRVRTLEELADTLLAFQNIPRLRGNQAAIISQLGGGAGGVAVSAADVCSRYGLHLPNLGKKIQDRLMSVIRAEGTILRNPYDLGMAVRYPEVLRDSLEIISGDSGVDFILVNERIDFLLLFSSMNEINSLNDILIDFKGKSEKPIIVVSTPVSADRERTALERRLLEAQIPVYPSFERAAKAITNVIKYWRNRSQIED